jgi:hypothetical protein
MSLKIRAFSLLILLLAAFGAQAQSKKEKEEKLSPEAIERLRLGEDTLALLAYAVVNDSIEAERFAVCRALIQTLVRTLKVENSFHYRFDRVKSVSILAPPDSSFRIFSWQLFVNDSTYRYYGAIQMNSRELKLFPLIDRSGEMDERPVYEAFPPEKWYGALYYNLRAFDTKEGTKYLLFGYDAYAFFEKRKVIEVLSFDAAGKPVFGAAVFEKPEAKVPEMRLLFEYSAEASARANWDEQYQMVLFDHLIPWPSPFGRGITFVPDGSYDGLKFEKGKWKFVEKVFNDAQEEAPRPEPLFDAPQNKDIMGKDKKQKKG